jgi:hypothetical protein
MHDCQSSDVVSTHPSSCFAYRLVGVYCNDWSAHDFLYSYFAWLFVFCHDPFDYVSFGYDADGFLVCCAHHDAANLVFIHQLGNLADGFFPSDGNNLAGHNVLNEHSRPNLKSSQVFRSIPDVIVKVSFFEMNFSSSSLTKKALI